jgi:hypothetical protein
VKKKIILELSKLKCLMIGFKSLDLLSSCCKTLKLEIGLELGTNGPYQNKTCYI